MAFTPEGELDLRALVLHLAGERDPGRGAALFHATLVWALAEWAARAARAQGLDRVACGGGCFLNAIVACGLHRALAARGLAMLQTQAVPPNDGGIALGQAWVALQSASTAPVPPALGECSTAAGASPDSPTRPATRLA